MTSREEVHLNGDWEGQMEVASCLTISAGGKAKANIKAVR
jgi:cytoskeletal protein CcmA (bactofilin family)